MCSSDDIIFQHSKIGIAFVDLNGSWIKVNEALCNMLGYTQQELLHSNFRNVTHPDDLNVSNDYVEQLLLGEKNYCAFDKRYVHKLGSTIWASITVSVVRDQAGKSVV